MKILILLPFSFYRPAGSPLNSYYRVKAIMELGNIVDIGTYPHGDDPKLPGLNIYRFPKKKIFKTIQPGEFVKKFVYDFFLFLNFIRLLIIKKYDLIIIHGTIIFPAILLKPAIRVPIIANIHGNIEEELSKWQISNSPGLYRFISRAEAWPLKYYTLIITVTENLREKLIMKGLSSLKIVTIPNSTDTATIEQEEKNAGEPFEILYTGTFVKIQNLRLLYETARKLSPDQFIFTLVGGNESELKENLNIIHKMGIENSVHLFPRMVPDKLKDFYKKAWIVVSPRIYGENEIPMKIYDYMNYGKCILATDVQIHRNILNKDVAFLTDSDPQSWANAIKHLHNHPEQVRVLGQNAKQFFNANFSFKNMIEKYQAVFDKIEDNK